MPHEWNGFGEASAAGMLAFLGAFWGAMLLLHGPEKTNAKILKLDRLQLQQAKANNFELLIKLELAELIKLELAEIGRTPQQPDPLLRLAHLIDEAEKRQTIDPQHAKLGRQLLNVFRMAVPLPAEHSTTSEAPAELDLTGGLGAQVWLTGNLDRK
jgi:hypothetical protein